MHKIINVKPLKDYRMWIRFSDNIEGEVDLSYLVGKGVFKAWNDYNFFKNVKISHSGELYWSDQIDLCPDSLYLKITGKSPEELFPSLNREVLNA